MNANGTNPVRLTIHPGLDDDPAWSPGGRKIAFVSAGRGGVSNNEIYVMNAAPESTANMPRQVTFDPHANDEQPNWSGTSTAPNGKIAFTKHHGDSQIYLINADGSSPTQLTNNPPELHGSQLVSRRQEDRVHEVGAWHQL